MTTVRPLTVDERGAFHLARLVSGEAMPYFSRALFAVTPLAAPGLGTFAVDAHWRLYMDPDRLLGPTAWSHLEAGAVLLHEVGHLVRGHAERARALSPQPVNDLAWNYAADAEINDDLVRADIGLPEGCITPADLGCEDGKTAEFYYRSIISAQQPDADVDFGDEAGCGSGSGSRAPEWELPAPSRRDDGLNQAEAEHLRRLVAADVKSYGSRARGTLPAGLDRWADSMLAPPQVHWTEVLRTTLRRSIAHRAGLTFHSYARPARRRVPGAILPAMRTASVGVSVVVDTSGSMAQTDLDAALAEIDGVLRTATVDRDRVRVLACDAATSVPQRVSSATKVKLQGGGGTDMRVGIAAATATRPHPDVVVVLTDGGTPWPDTELPHAELVIVAIGNENATTPKWAATVHIPTGAGR